MDFPEYFPLSRLLSMLSFSYPLESQPLIFGFILCAAQPVAFNQTFPTKLARDGVLLVADSRIPLFISVSVYVSKYAKK